MIGGTGEMNHQSGSFKTNSETYVSCGTVEKISPIKFLGAQCLWHPQPCGCTSRIPVNPCLPFCHCQFLFRPTNNFLENIDRKNSSRECGIQTCSLSSQRQQHSEYPNSTTRVLPSARPGSAIYTTLALIL